MCTYMVTSHMTTVQEPPTGSLPQKGYLPRRNVYQQDELSPQHKDALFAGEKVPPPCPAEDSQHQDPSKDSTNNLNTSRCQFTFSDGRQCRMPRAQLCAHHASRKES